MTSPSRALRRRRLTTVIFLLLVAVGAWQYLGRWGSTPPFRDASGEVVSGSVAEMQRVRLGGVDQSMTIRGRSAKAPILIWLHGGPGQDETGLMRKYNASLEDHFLVTYWIQRGTGRSYRSDIPASSMNIAQYVSDLDELIAYMKKRFGSQKVVLIGHSWGSSLGVAYAQAHPENVAAIVGVGQVVNAAEGEKRAYHFALDEAKKRGNPEATRELTALGEPPYPIESILVQRKWGEEFGGGNFRKPTSLINLMWQSYGASEVTLMDGIYFLPGANFSLDTMSTENAKVDWWKNAKKFQMPVFILTGRHDHMLDASLQKAYFDRIDAPTKEFRWFENSAHSPLFEESDAFNKFIVEKVLPVTRE
jgi:proline iminopeptidase